MANQEKDRASGMPADETPASKEGNRPPRTWRTPPGISPDDIVSSGTSGGVRTPPSGQIDDARTADETRD